LFHLFIYLFNIEITHKAYKKNLRTKIKRNTK